MKHEREHRPLRTYTLLTLAFNASAWSVAALFGRDRRIRGADLAVLGAATHEVSRIVAKEPVARPLRKPFAVVAEDGHEEPKPGTLRHAIGELVTCPYCLAPWVALALTTTYLIAPRATRIYASVLSVAAVSDFLQRASSLLNEKRAELHRRAEAERLPAA